MSSGLLQAYENRIAAGELHPDAAQRAAVVRFADLAEQIAVWTRSRRGLGRFFRASQQAPKGLYVHGSVGRGKTFLMDLFFDAIDAPKKRRVHFHEFMADVHDRIGGARERTPGDPIPLVATEIAEEAQLLCFDEMHVTDIADAMILGRLFTGLFEQQVVVVATSNAHPTELYKNGLNRQLFLPFIESVGRYMEIWELDADRDFRLEKLSGRPLYFTPADVAARDSMDKLWADLTGGGEAAACSLEVKGRVVDVPQAAMGVARFGFADLCEKPLGSLDYLSIARAFHTIMIDDIPRLPPAKRNEARRFINLIDTLYDNRICLVASAEAEPADLYPDGDGAELFERTVSRLIEMRSQEYLAARADRLKSADDGSGDAEELEPVAG